MAGDHVPLIPFREVVGNAGGVEFWHSGPITLNVGPTCDVTTTFIVADVPHCPVAGVNVCVVVPTAEVLIVAGLQVPVTPFVDVAGSVGATLFWQSGGICVNIGVTRLVIVTASVALAPH